MSIVKNSRLVSISSRIVVILWILLIFALSAQTGEQSAGLSSQVTKIIIKTVTWVMPMDTNVRTIDKMVQKFNNIVRKFAHAGLYLGLGILVINSNIKKDTKGFKPYVYAVIFCMVYAVTDEAHQTLVAGRTGQVSDIVIDTTGAIVGISMCWMYKTFKE